MSFAAKIGLGLLLALVSLVGMVALGIYYLERISAAKVDPAHAPYIARLEQSLHTKGYFTPREIGYPNAIFFCVCGPYRSCDDLSQKLALQLDYVRPQRDFATGMGRSRVLLMYFLPGEIIAIEMQHAPPWFIEEHDGFCSQDVDMKIPRQGGTQK